MANRLDAHQLPGSGSMLFGGFALGSGLFRMFLILPNFTPVGALGVFAGARMRWWQALAVPLVVMAVSDLLLQSVYGFAPFHPLVYACIAVNVLLGRAFLRRSSSPWRITGVSLLASVQFFLFTNLGVWLSWPLYPRTLVGLMQCYVAGLPFFQYTLLGDLVFCGVMFGAYALVARRSVGLLPAAPRLEAS